MADPFEGIEPCEVCGALVYEQELQRCEECGRRFCEDCADPTWPGHCTECGGGRQMTRRGEAEVSMTPEERRAANADLYAARIREGLDLRTGRPLDRDEAKEVLPPDGWRKRGKRGGEARARREREKHDG